MVNYNNVAKGVEPKRRKVAEAEKNLRIAQKDLIQTKQALDELNTQLAMLSQQFEEKTAEQKVCVWGGGGVGRGNSRHRVGPWGAGGGATGAGR